MWASNALKRPKVQPSKALTAFIKAFESSSLSFPMTKFERDEYEEDFAEVFEKLKVQKAVLGTALWFSFWVKFSSTIR